MNRRHSGRKPDKAILGFLRDKMAEGHSPNTLRVWAERKGDKWIEEITSDDLLSLTF